LEAASPRIVEKFLNCGFTQSQIQQLHVYGSLIHQWNKAINLVAPSTLPQLWERHLLDSAQLWKIISSLCYSERREESVQDPSSLPSVGMTSIVDLGSGGGLPGIVLAIAGATVTMVESDKRKCIFLQEVSRETKLANVTIINERIEKATPAKADFVTARALAPLGQLIEWATPLIKEDGRMLFLKGADVQSEINILPLGIKQKIQLFPSITDKDARIVLIS
jgi:16S rRNA (guanine527-N7)-methyltransferase